MPRYTRRVRGALLLLVLAGLLVAVGLLALEVRADERRERDEREALQAARESATALTSLDHRQSDQDVDRVLAGATGELAQQFRDSRDRLRTLLGSRRSASSGTVLEAGLVQLAQDEAEVLLAVDAEVTDADTQASGGAPRVQRYRMSLELRRVGDRWQAERVLFAGAPDELAVP